MILCTKSRSSAFYGGRAFGACKACLITPLSRLSRVLAAARDSSLPFSLPKNYDLAEAMEQRMEAEGFRTLCTVRRYMPSVMHGVAPVNATQEQRRFDILDQKKRWIDTLQFISVQWRKTPQRNFIITGGLASTPWGRACFLPSSLRSHKVLLEDREIAIVTDHYLRCDFAFSGGQQLSFRYHPNQTIWRGTSETATVRVVQEKGKLPPTTHGLGNPSLPKVDAPKSESNRFRQWTIELSGLVASEDDLTLVLAMYIGIFCMNGYESW